MGEAAKEMTAHQRATNAMLADGWNGLQANPGDCDKLRDRIAAAITLAVSEAIANQRRALWGLSVFEAVAHAVAEEREACAKLAIELDHPGAIGPGHASDGYEIAAAIRARTGPMTAKLGPNEFRCAMCGGIFEKGRPDEEAVAEREKLFGFLREEECDLVCEDCFQKMHPDNHPHAAEEAMAETIRARSAP